MFLPKLRSLSSLVRRGVFFGFLIVWALALGCSSRRVDTTKSVLPKSGVYLTVQAVGDLNLGGRAKEITSWAGYDYPFDGTRSLLAVADINFANLEAPVTDRGKALEKEFTFQNPPKAFPHIKSAGFNFFSLANNHMLDYGNEGLEQTIQILKKLDFAYSGAGRNLAAARTPAIRQIRGARVGMLAYSLTFPESFYATDTQPGTAFGHEGHIREDVAKLRPLVDLILVSFHWGQEKRKTPKEYQKYLAHVAIDSGADLILGHHPHVVQGLELYKGRLIIYSLGNYTFGSYSKSVSWGAFLKTQWHLQPQESPRLLSAEVVPLNVDNFQVDFCPTPLKAEKAKVALEELKNLSEALKTRLIIKGNRAHVALEPDPPEPKIQKKKDGGLGTARK